jgi:hypothetical protein
MSRSIHAAAACLALLFLAEAAQAQGPAGRWKLRVTQEAQTITFLVALTESDGKWVGDFLGSSVELQREPKFGAVEVSGDSVRFTLLFGGREFVSFDGVLAKDGKKLSGSVSQFGGPLRLTDLYPSKLKKVDDVVELAREDVAQVEGGDALFEAGFAVLAQAAAKKLPLEEVRGIADKLAKAAGGYGGRWERTTALKLATTLAGQAGFADVALAQARRAERMLTDDSPTPIQMEVLDTLAAVMTKAGKPDEAKKYAAMVQQFETKDYAEFVKTGLGFTPEPYKGRKAKSDRAVLVEAVTTSESASALPFELASVGLARTYKPTEAIVVQYHVLVPRIPPDPLASPEIMERARHYQEQLESLPTVFVNGKVRPTAAKGPPSAKDWYGELRDGIEKQLETPATVKLALTVTPGEKGAFTAKAAVSDLEAPGEKVRLRFVLTEERVRYAGASGARYHSYVARAVPGDPKGYALTKKAHEQAVTIDPTEVRAKLGKFLDDFAKSGGEFLRPDRPLALTNLKLVAFVQNDATGEVLQAVQADVK